VKELLEMIGLRGQRVYMVNVSSAMGGQFAASASEISDAIKKLGPNPLKRQTSQEEKET
jgi:coenzyme F420-reducing hydrogenase delta subunit